MKPLSELLQHLPIVAQYGSADTVFDIQYDSRRVQLGSLYVARKSATVDGQAFIPQAIAAGASVIVCEQLPEIELSACCFVVVKDSQTALAILSHAFYDFPSRSMRMIAVTGTNGKTTCTFILKQLLEALGERVGLIGTTGNYTANQREDAQFTTPEAPELCALLQRMHEAEVSTVVMEVSSHALELKRVHGISFAAALFTNLTQDHLDFHGTMESYLDAKKLLFDELDRESIAVVNADDPSAAKMLANCRAHRFSIGRTDEVPAFALRHYRIHAEQLSAEYSRFSLNDQQWSSKLIGSFNIDNLALCLSACLELGYSPSDLQAALPKVVGAAGRMQRIPLSSGVVAVVDYAHSPDALEKALKNLRQSMSSGKLFCVFGAGGDRDRTKRPLMGLIAEALSDVVIVTNDNPRSEDPQAIATDIIAGMREPTKCGCILDRSNAIATALREAQAGDVVLLAGKGHEEYQIIGTERRHFSDVEEVLRAGVGEARA